MLPLVQWQEISFAQPAALTWSNFTLLFSGERRAGPNSKVLGMAYIGCSCLFKGRAEFSSISETYVCTCLCVCFFLAQQFISEILWHMLFLFFQTHSHTFQTWPFLLCTLLASLTQIPAPSHHFHCLLLSTLLAYLFPCPPKLLLFHCLSAYIAFSPTITVSSHSVLLPYLPLHYIPSGWGLWISKCGVRVCVFRYVCVSLKKRGEKGKGRREKKGARMRVPQGRDDVEGHSRDRGCSPNEEHRIELMSVCYYACM